MAMDVKTFGSLLNLAASFKNMETDQNAFSAGMWEGFSDIVVMTYFCFPVHIYLGKWSRTLKELYAVFRSLNWLRLD